MKKCGSRDYGQKFTVQWLEEKAKTEEYVGVFCIATDLYEERLPNHVHVIGRDLYQKNGIREVLRCIQRQSPTHIICCFPSRRVLSWAIYSSIRTLPLFADSFQTGGFRNSCKNYLLKRILNHPHFDWVANHNLNASLSLKEIGVDAKKIIPWDFPALINPYEYPCKNSLGDAPIRLLYVGSLIESKGVGDAISAVEILKKRGKSVELILIGKGDERALFQDRAKSLGVDKEVHFLGTVDHSRILEMMHQASVLLVPSWHEYPEGMPMTIYESFCSHTPLVASNHPMFQKKLQHRENCLIFQAGDSQALAEAILELMQDPILYRHISSQSTAAWENLRFGVNWDELLERWLRNDLKDREWLANHCLSALLQE